MAYLRGVRKGKQPYPDLVVLSPGPGNPSDFGLSDTIREARVFHVTSFLFFLALGGSAFFLGLLRDVVQRGRGCAGFMYSLLSCLA